MDKGLPVLVKAGFSPLHDIWVKAGFSPKYHVIVNDCFIYTLLTWFQHQQQTQYSSSCLKQHISLFF